MLIQNYKPLVNTKAEFTKKDAEVVKQFEAMFVKQMLNSMASTLDKGLFSSSAKGSNFYQTMVFDKLSMQIANQSSLGLDKQFLHKKPQNIDINIRALNASDYMKVSKYEFENSLENLPELLRKRLKKLDTVITKAAQKHDLDKKLIQSVIACESYANPNAVSPVGAKGLMQLMDATAKSLDVTDSFNIEQNINGGSKYLRQMLDKYEDLDKALAAYNAGPAVVDKYNGIPPYKETINYVEKVKTYCAKIEQGGKKWPEQKKLF